jgi:hypothetical protein
MNNYANGVDPFALGKRVVNVRGHCFRCGEWDEALDCYTAWCAKCLQAWQHAA